MRIYNVENSISGGYDPFGRISVGLLPPLSAYNGPSFLLHAIEVLQARDVPATNVRLIPVIAEALCPEIAPYEDQLRQTEWAQTFVRQYRDYFARPQFDFRAEARGEDFDSAPRLPFPPEQLIARLGVNIRADNRLLNFFPLIRLGLVKPEWALAWERRGISPRQGYAEALAGRDPDGAAPAGLWTRPGSDIFRASYQERSSLEDADPERIAPSALPEERLALQISKLLRLPLEPHFAPPHRYDFGINESRWQRHFYLAQGTPARLASPGPHHAAQQLVEVFYTWALLAVACADNLIGFEYVLPIEPKGRAAALEITARSSPEDVARWLQWYPHRPLRRDEGRANPATWDAADYGVARFHEELGHFYRGEIYRAGGRGQSVWLRGARAKAKDAAPPDAPPSDRPPPLDRSLPLPTDEILARAARHLPNFLPDYPRQSAIIGGLNLEGLLISLMERWRSKGTFLGVSQAQWESLLTPAEQLMLGALLALRAQIPDQRLLFEEAARLLIHPDVKVWQEEYQPCPIRLGTPLAQLNYTMTLKRNAALHAPEIIMRIPLDETRDEREEEIIGKIDLLKKLFLPAHLRLHPIWNVNRPRLGKTAFLRGPATSTFLGDPAPTARIAADGW